MLALFPCWPYSHAGNAVAGILLAVIDRPPQKIIPGFFLRPYCVVRTMEYNTGVRGTNRRVPRGSAAQSAGGRRQPGER